MLILMPTIGKRFVPFMENCFDSVFSGTVMDRNKTSVAEKDGNIVVQMEVAGFSKENISIDLKDDVMTVTGEAKEETENQQMQRSFSKTFSVKGIDAEKISAKCKDGILTITCPKLEPEPESKKQILIE